MAIRANSILGGVVLSCCLSLCAASAGTPVALDQTGDPGGSASLVVAAPLVQRAPTSTRAMAHPVALAVNLPLQWGHAVGGSVRVGINDHHAVLGDFSRYEPEYVFSLFRGDGANYGRNVDSSISWGYFPRKVFSGASFEVGVLYRDRVNQNDGQSAADNYDIHSRIVAAQGLIGWSWRVGNNFYVTAAVGASYGYDRSTVQDFNHTYETTSLPRFDASPEGYLRFGVVVP